MLLFSIAASPSGCGEAIHKMTSNERIQKPSSAEEPASPMPDQLYRSARHRLQAFPKPKSPSLPDFSEKERDPQRLLDLGRHELASILGKPAFIRRDMSAEVWQYRTDACVLDLFLYNFESPMTL